MGKVIEAKAVITASDQTGGVFDAIARKMEGVAKTAKSFDGIRGPQKFFGDFDGELARLKLTEKELQSVRKSFGDLDRTLRSGGPLRAQHYFRAMDDWKTNTVDHWRQVKSGIDEADKAHQKFFKNAGYFALHAAGVGGAAYAAGHAIRSGVGAAAARNRETIRYEQMGLTDDQFSQAGSVADQVSLKFPSLSRTEILADLRKNTSRLGDFDRAKEIAETYARAKIMNKLSGGDEHELEQVVRAAEGAGAANTSAQFSVFLNAFSRAKAANPDYTGESFAKDFRAAGAAKYGLGQDYMENVFPILASHTTGFGVKLATSNSALIGGRMTKQSKAALAGAGLLDKNGKLIDETGYQKNPFDWTQQHIRPILEAKGVTFGEHMSEEDKRTTAAWASKSFSAKNVADQIITNLIDATLVERARNRKTMGLEGVDSLQRKDAGLAWESVENQLKDASTAMMNLGPVVTALNNAATSLTNFTKFIESGKVPENTNLGRALRPQTPEERTELNRQDNAKLQIAELKTRLYGLDDDRREATRAMRLKLFELRMKRDAQQMQAGAGPLFGDAEIQRWRDSYVPIPMADPRRMLDGRRISFPTPDPRRGSGDGTSDMPPVQSLEGAKVQAELTGSANVAGSVDVNVKVEAGSSLIAIEESVKSLLAHVTGLLRTNGPGSMGVSSPDAAAPAPSGRANGPGY